VFGCLGHVCVGVWGCVVVWVGVCVWVCVCVCVCVSALSNYMYLSQDTELKVAILELISESIVSQPGLMELFLCVKMSGKGSNVAEKVKKDSKKKVSMKYVSI